MARRITRKLSAAPLEPEGPAQLKLSFSTDNPLGENLRRGEFSVLVEVNAPPREQPCEPAVAVAERMAREIRDVPWATGMAVTDRLRSEDCYDAASLVGLLATASGKPVLMHLSGKGSDKARVQEMLARGLSAGARSLLAVTGDRSDKHPAPHGLARNPPHPVGYFDSVETLHTAAASGHGFLLGAGVNPFKYNVADQCLQRYKMVRKLATGAQFLVTHAGWDMKKLQELQWFLQMRQVDVPVIARVALLSGDQIRALQDDVFPGVFLSRTFASVLQRESEINDTQSLAAQLQRLGLQVAGCRLLGYSGVQVVGVRDERTLAMVLKRIDEALAAFTSYPEWVAAWTEHHMSMEFSPLAGVYYGFPNLLTPQHQFYEAGATVVSRALPLPSRGDRRRSTALRLCLSRVAPEFVKKAGVGVLARGWTARRDRLAYTFHLSPEACPKRLVFGACGGAGADGTCEFGGARCFFHRVLAIAARRGRLDRLEQGLTGD